MDVQMPELNGLEVSRIIRESEQKSGTRIPIIALTASANDSDKTKCLQSGMDDFLTKPIDKETLLTVLHKWADLDHTNSTP